MIEYIISKGAISRIIVIQIDLWKLQLHNAVEQVVCVRLLALLHKAIAHTIQGFKPSIETHGIGDLFDPLLYNTKICLAKDMFVFVVCDQANVVEAWRKVPPHVFDDLDSRDLVEIYDPSGRVCSVI